MNEIRKFAATGNPNNRLVNKSGAFAWGALKEIPYIRYRFCLVEGPRDPLK